MMPQPPSMPKPPSSQKPSAGEPVIVHITAPASNQGATHYTRCLRSVGGAENVRPHYHGIAAQDGSQTARPSSKYRRAQPSSSSGQSNSARAATRQHDPQLPINPPSHPVPITPQNAVKMYQGELSNYELSEVLDYPQIYYVGTGGQKVRNTSVNKVRRAFRACVDVLVARSR